jgi:GH24 family phage-related lysozyme (muramidase)
MSNNKQSSVEWYIIERHDIEIQSRLGKISPIEYDEQLTKAEQQAKEKYEHEMCEFAAEYAQYELQQNKPGIKGAMVSMCAWTFFKNRKK